MEMVKKLDLFLSIILIPNTYKINGLKRDLNAILNIFTSLLNIEFFNTLVKEYQRQHFSAPFAREKRGDDA